jgi:hypothetical protein
MSGALYIGLVPKAKALLMVEVEELDTAQKRAFMRRVSYPAPGTSRGTKGYPQ